MKALVLKKYGNADRAFSIEDRPKPTIGDNDVLIKVHSTGLNFADVVARRGLYPDAPKNPAILGYDVGGTVEAIGASVEGLEIGQRVTGLTRFGGYAEYASTMSEGVAAIPDSMSYEVATALATQACTAYYCAHEMVKMHEGDRVLVQAAAGGVGSILVQLAKHAGCIVFGTASSSKQGFLKEQGVDYPIDYTQQDFRKIINEETKDGIDIVFDSIGGKAFSKGMKCLNPGGRMVSFGAASQINGDKTSKVKALGVVLGFGIISPIALLMKSQSITTVNMLRIADYRPHVFKKCLDEVVRLYEEGVIQPKIAKVFPYEEIADAHVYLESRSSIGKVVVNW